MAELANASHHQLLVRIPEVLEHRNRILVRPQERVEQNGVQLIQELVPFDTICLAQP